MKIVVTGAHGQLGRDMVETLLERGHEAIGLGRHELDICDQAACQAAMRELRPDAVIHCAAYTAVDRAETDADAPYAVNAWGTRNMAAAAAAVGAKVVYVSTDYVFDGTSLQPYVEYDLTNPRSVYGKSKLAGEQLLQTLCSRYFIVRTSWVFGRHGANFVKTMLKLGAEKDQLKVVNDQIGSPTYTIDLASFIVDLVETERYGIYHASNAGSCSWFEFAQAIFAESGQQVEVLPCTTEEFPRPAPRPRYSVMEHMAIRTNGFVDLRPWREALSDFVSRMDEGSTP